jgi:hypothetical protein
VRARRSISRTLSAVVDDRQLRKGVYLIDLSVDPLASGGPPLADAVPGLVKRASALSTEKVIVIKAKVYDAAFAALRAGQLC